MQPRVLIVDDDPTSRRLMELALRDVCAKGGAALEQAQSGEEALDRLRRSDYAIIISDQVMPGGMSGLEFLQHAALMVPTSIRVLVTGNPDAERQVERMDRGSIFRVFARTSELKHISAFVAEGLRLCELERQQRELLKTLGAKTARLEERGRLLEDVVRDKTRELVATNAKLRQANRQIILVLAEAIEAKDPYTKGHCGRVAALSIALAQICGYPEDQMEALEFAAFLHDIGKIGVRDAVLLKPGALADDEWDHMRIHPVVGDDIVRRIEMLRESIPAIRNHHERWNGTGYPDKLAGEAIPLSARIVAIADAWDAMATDRPYKKAMAVEECYGHLRKRAGEWFDPALVDQFIRNDLGRILGM